MQKSLTQRLSEKLRFVQDNMVEELIDYLDMGEVESKINSLFDEFTQASESYESDQEIEEDDDEEEDDE